MKKGFITIFFILYSLFTPHIVFAEYVLPYPSVMPGNKIYKLTRIVDSLKGYWYFGSIAQQKYHLALADKYLVEAKTLFEYKQYLLAVDALLRSDKEFSRLPKNSITKEAAMKHTEVLAQIKTMVPSVFTWSPEKSANAELLLHSDLDASIALRNLWQ